MIVIYFGPKTHAQYRNVPVYNEKAFPSKDGVCRQAGVEFGT